MENKKVVVQSSKSLFWPTFWLILFWPLGLVWLAYRLQYNFRIEKDYFPTIVLLIAIGFYIAYAWIHHDWTLSPISWLMNSGIQ